MNSVKSWVFFTFFFVFHVQTGFFDAWTTCRFVNGCVICVSDVLPSFTRVWFVDWFKIVGLRSPGMDLVLRLFIVFIFYPFTVFV